MRAHGGQSLSAATGSIGPGGLVLLNARGRMDSDNSYTPMRRSPLRDEDADWDDAQAIQGSHSEIGHRVEAGPVHFPFSTEPLISNTDLAELGFESSVVAGDQTGTHPAGGRGLSSEGTGLSRQALLSDMSAFPVAGPSLLEAAGLSSADSRARAEPSTNFDGAAANRPSQSSSTAETDNLTPTQRRPSRASFTIAPASYAAASTSGSGASPVRRRPSTPPLASTRTNSLLPSQVYNPPPESPKDSSPTRRGSVTWSTFGYPYLPPPSAWASGEKDKEKAASSRSPITNEFEADTFGRARSRSSVDASSSGHGHVNGRGLGALSPIVSSQRHGSATASGSLENEPNSGSALGFFSSSGEGSGSSGSHGQSSSSVNQHSHRRTLSAGAAASLGEGAGSRESELRQRDRDSGSFLSRVASTVSASLRRPPSGQSSVSGGLPARQSRSRSRSKTPEFPPGLPASVIDPVGSKVLGPPQPRSPPSPQANVDSLEAESSAPSSIRASALRRLSLLSGGKVTSATSPNVQAALATAALSASSSSIQALQQQRSSLQRPQPPGALGEFPPSLPGNAAAAMMARYSGHSYAASGGTFGRLSVIQASPSPLPTPDTTGAAALEGLLDPRLTARLRDLRSATQTSLSTIGLRDHEDYSRPIHGLVNNPHDSYGSVSSRYSQSSGTQGAGSDRGGVSGTSTPLRTSVSGSPVIQNWELATQGSDRS